MTSVFSRIGAAYQAGVPFGAALGVAQNTPDDNTAAAFGYVAPQPAAPVAATTAPPQSTAPQAAATQGPGWVNGIDTTRVYATWADVPRANGFWNKVGSIASNVGHVLQNAMVNAEAAPGGEWVFKNANKGAEFTGNVAETTQRTAADRQNKARAEGGFKGFFDYIGGALRTGGEAALGPVGGWITQDDAWLSNWDKVVKADSSIGQTVWLQAKGQLAGDPYADYSLLDDPANKKDREEYFSSGSQKWVTGAGDALWNMTMDPVIWGGKAAAAVRASRAVLRTADVARAYDITHGVVDAAKVSGKTTALMGTVDNLVALHDVAATHPGTLAAMAKSHLLKQVADSGGILGAMDQADVIFKGNTVARNLAKHDILYAGAGDRRALAALEQQSKILSASLHGILRPNIDAELVQLEHLSAPENVGDVLHRVSDSIPVQNEIAAQIDEITKGFDAIKAAEKIPTAEDLAAADEFTKEGIRNTARVLAVGTAHAGTVANMLPGAVGEIRTVQRASGLIARE